MKTYHHSTIQRHIAEGGEYDEHGDGSVTLRNRYPRNTCPKCGKKHPTNPNGWRNDRGFKIFCPDCQQQSLERYGD